MRSCSLCHTPYTTRIEFCGLDGAPVVEVARDPLIGKYFDRHRVVESLGGGGMAAVYRAVHDVIDREVAIKVLFGELASDRAFAERFRREAQAASRIKHPSVVEILDFGATKEGMSFLVMEMLKGETLSDAITRAGAFPPRRAASVLRQVAAGLGAAHASGFVHRDLKPGNIMLTAADPGAEVLEIAKILDFGLVQARADENAPEDRLTKTGQTMGTPFYMAPEQFQGGEATPLSDLYSLGAVLHEMLAGTSPFRGSLGEVVVQVTTSRPPKLAKADGLEKLSQKLLEKNPKKRPQSTAEVVRAIDALKLGPVRESDIVRRPKTVELHDLEDIVASIDASKIIHDDDSAVIESRPRSDVAAARAHRNDAPDGGHDVANDAADAANDDGTGGDVADSDLTHDDLTDDDVTAPPHPASDNESWPPHLSDDTTVSDETIPHAAALSNADTIHSLASLSPPLRPRVSPAPPPPPSSSSVSVDRPVNEPSRLAAFGFYVVTFLVVAVATATFASWLSVLTVPPSMWAWIPPDLRALIDHGADLKNQQDTIHRTKAQRDAVVGEITAALRKRGLSIHDAAHIETLMPLAERGLRSLDVDTATEIAGRFLPEIAKARIDHRVLKEKHARLAAVLKHPPSTLAVDAVETLRADLATLNDAFTLDLSEAECSHHARALAEIEDVIVAATAKVPTGTEDSD